MTFEGLVKLIRSHIHFSGHTWIAVEDLARALEPHLKDDNAAELEAMFRLSAACMENRQHRQAMDAALTDEQIIEIFHDHYTEEPGDAEPGHILPFARAILAAKEKKS
jgi:hypothetical protein